MKTLRFVCVSLLLAVSLAVPGLASADVNNFTITSFDSDQTLSRNDPQGELRIVEKIHVDFTDNNHGILRSIPERYKNHSLQLKINRVSSESGAASQYSTYSQNGNTVLKIGSPSRTVTGAQQYTIDYTLRNVISFYDNHAELYWDVNGNDWQQPFTKVTMNLHLPEGVKLTERPSCYTGSFGSSANECTITQEGNTVTAATIRTLYAGENLTYVAAFEAGYFTPSAWYETIAEYSRAIIGFTLPFILLGGASVLTWWRRGRDSRGRGTIVPQYDAPDAMSPLAVETIMNFNASNRAITATIIRLAIEGYLKIIETKKDRLIGKDALSYSLELTKSDFSQLDEHDKRLITALFPSGKSGDVNELSASKSKLYSTAAALKTSAKAELTTAGYFRASPRTKLMQTLATLLMLAATVIVGIIWFGGWFIGGLVAGGLVAIVFWIFMDARTAQGVAAKEHIEGLKLYLNTAEKDRINKLQAPNAEYAAPSTEPAKTVELFEKLLPFAIVLGVENGWAKQFESLYTTPPDWYSGNWSAFHAGYLASSISSGVGAAVSSSFSPPASSSSSGSGGGGSSGGGGGGGGGGGW